MSDIPGGAPVDRSRPDDEPTINEAGADGFLVDGTDSFAVPGPVDVVPAEDVPEPPAVSRTRLLVTAGAVAAGLAFVVAVGRGGAGDAGPSLRADGVEAPVLALSQWGADDGDVVLVVPDPADEDTLRRLEAGRVASEGGTLATTDPNDIAIGPDATAFDDGYDGYDDGYGYDVSMPSYPGFDDEYFDDDSFDDFPSYRPTSPRRLPVIPVPRVTVPRPVTTTTLAVAPEAETTTTPAPAEETTTTVEETTTSSSTTQPAPGPAWAAVSEGLPECPASLRVWARGDGVVAASAATLYARAGTTWSPLGAVIPDATVIRAFAPGSGSTYAVGTDAGVFRTTDDGAHYTELGDLPDVRTLAVSPDGASLLAVTQVDQLRRWDDAAARWSDPATLPVPAGTPLGDVSFVDATHAILGTGGGVLRSADSGTTWTSVASSAVVGEPVRGTDSIYWLLAGGAGVLRSSALDGASWTAYAGADAIASDSTTLVVRPGQLLTWGDAGGTAAPLIASVDGGTSWSAVQPAPPYRPDGLVHVGTATYGYTADCALGAPGGADSVLRLADP